MGDRVHGSNAARNSDSKVMTVVRNRAAMTDMFVEKVKVIQKLPSGESATVIYGKAPNDDTRTKYGEPSNKENSRRHSLVPDGQWSC